MRTRPAPKHAAPSLPAGPIQAPAKVEQLVLRRIPVNEVLPCQIRFEKYPSVIVARFYDAEGRQTGETNHPLASSVADLIDDYWPRGWELAESHYLYCATAKSDDAGEFFTCDCGRDEPTQPIAGVVVDETRKPVQREGLAHVPAPSLPMPVDEPQAAGPRPFVAHVGSALPARMTEWERALLGGLTHEQATQATLDQDQAWQARIDRLTEYFRQVDERFERGPVHYVREKTRFDLDQIERRSAWLRQKLVERPYRFGPQQQRSALPHRTPGAFRSEIEASRGTAAAL